MQAAQAEVRNRLAARREAARLRKAEQTKRAAMTKAVEKFTRTWEREYDRKHKPA